MVILISGDFLVEGLLTGQAARVYPTASWSKTDDSQTCFAHFQAWPALTVSGTVESEKDFRDQTTTIMLHFDPKQKTIKLTTLPQFDLAFYLCDKELEGLLTFSSDVKTDSKS